MRAADGYVTIFSAGPLIEYDTVQCCHCGSVIKVKPGSASTVYLITDRQTLQTREELGAGCWHCQKPVCLPCHAKGTCLPLERQLDQWERVSRRA